MSVQTIQAFAEACRDLTADEIYNLFEFEIPDSLRDDIFALASPDSKEPVREALNLIGRSYLVRALVDY